MLTDRLNEEPGNTKGGIITVLLISCLTGLDWSVLQIKTKTVSCHTADSKPVRQGVNGTVILLPLVFPGGTPRVQCPWVLACLMVKRENEKGHGQTLAYRTSLGPSFQL